MRRSAASLVAAGLLGLAAAAPAPGRVTESAPERVMVRGSEFDLVLSKPRVSPGRAIVQFVNAGEDPHDLRIARVGDEGEFGFGVVGPGEYENLDARLRKRSRYVLWCSFSDHRERGMEATLRTRRHRR